MEAYSASRDANGTRNFLESSDFLDSPKPSQAVKHDTEARVIFLNSLSALSPQLDLINFYE